ncbi:MAG: translation initiation factor 2 [Ruminiclostridium sp.]|jgi:hypothetical protein|nr:translation initiation factor 2 [Ruminiclostridium sp.]MCI9465950.1 translation initiation factor 2 [Ruminiclostridium sp.]
MVKGVTRQVVVVKSPAPKIDEAIFLLREPVAPDPSSEREALRQALRVADEYILQNTPQGRRRRMIQPILFTLLGCGLASALWGAALFFSWPL